MEADRNLTGKFLWEEVRISALYTFLTSNLQHFPWFFSLLVLHFGQSMSERFFSPTWSSLEFPLHTCLLVVNPEEIIT